MNARTLKVLEEALELSVEDRTLLTAELEASLETEAAAEEIEMAWAEEIERRSRDVDEGRAAPVAAAEVHGELRARLRAKR